MTAALSAELIKAPKIEKVMNVLSKPNRKREKEGGEHIKERIRERYNVRICVYTFSHQVYRVHKRVALKDSLVLINK